ncbi:DUF488 domain-containing protein [Burkholderia cenocepacia]|uniref:DUF488 domain-containing protein n=1 Tax=Burkholderia cenocepacia TaxID=95486 RepID=UPI00285446DB|nr:DUF488 domain-containing protein [Burkholderia cenocepacia]MDR8027958.1 DUF488 domain-containing protein [Burkholderia cenocepacia]MDR8045193.1 DUF488 domain-containing protein [Burkholderia cenocepacia]
MNLDIFTIGHSTQGIEKFLQRIKRHEVTAVADVRSAPYSRRNPQFNREELRAVLKENGVRYVFLGKELGARSDDECCYVDDKVQYALLAQTDLFKSGINRVIDGAQSFRVALMCAEKDPLDCHRTILVARELIKRGHRITHILGDGQLEAHAQAMSRLIAQLGLSGQDMFRSEEATLNEAYDTQAERIAYNRKGHRSAKYGLVDEIQNEG